MLFDTRKAFYLVGRWHGWFRLGGDRLSGWLSSLLSLFLLKEKGRRERLRSAGSQNNSLLFNLDQNYWTHTQSTPDNPLHKPPCQSTCLRSRHTFLSQQCWSWMYLKSLSVHNLALLSKGSEAALYQLTLSDEMKVVRLKTVCLARVYIFDHRDYDHHDRY